MVRTKKGNLFLAAIVILTVLFASLAPAKIVKADDPVELYTYEDLFELNKHPDGSFILMADIDCSSQIWTPIDFQGTLDGNGHAILNLKVNGCGGTRADTYDGNMVRYDTYFSGFFNVLKNATVSNLTFLGTDISVDTANPCFAGGIAGMMDNSTITNCKIEGQIKVSTDAKSFGTGGIAGFGNGLIEKTTADVTLICFDKDVEYKEEQFMGGAYAAGYINLKDNTIKIKGYDSDHGYVHNGGLVGMYIIYDDIEFYGAMTGNSVDGFITFYEDNEDRRAYCEAFIGEIMDWDFENDGSVTDEHFVRDELFYEDFYDEWEETYLTLEPHMCGEPDMVSKVVPATETEYGYTEYSCNNCDYSYRANYTKLAGAEQPETETITEEGGEKETVPDVKPEKRSVKKMVFIIILAVILAAVIAFIILLIVKNQQRKKRAKMRAQKKAAIEAKRRQQSQSQRPPREE